MRNLLVAACVTAAALSGGAQAGAIDQLKQFVAATKSAHASFNQSVTGRAGRKPQLSTGQMAFSRPGKFRWAYEKPYPQLLVGDGRKLWVYDPDLNQVTVTPLGRGLGSSPAALLAGQLGDDGAIEKNFNLTEAGKRDGLDWVEARPKVTDSGFERMQIGFEGSELQAMEIVDNFGQTTRIRFSTFDKNPKMPAGMFTFTPPKGADVVGEK